MCYVVMRHENPTPTFSDKLTNAAGLCEKHESISTNTNMLNRVIEGWNLLNVYGNGNRSSTGLTKPTACLSLYIHREVANVSIFRRHLSTFGWKPWESSSPFKCCFPTVIHAKKSSEMATKSFLLEEGMMDRKVNLSNQDTHDLWWNPNCYSNNSKFYTFRWLFFPFQLNFLYKPTISLLQRLLLQIYTKYFDFFSIYNKVIYIYICSTWLVREKRPSGKEKLIETALTFQLNHLLWTCDQPHIYEHHYNLPGW